MKYITSLILLSFLFYPDSYAQHSSAIEAPKQINASDGIYDRFILVRWEPAENAIQYKVFRSAKPEVVSLQEVSNGWQKSTWVCDYSALPNTDYYYTVVASTGEKLSNAGTFDKGFLKKTSAVAIEESHLLTEAEVYGAQKHIFLLISEVSTQSPDYLPGDVLNFSVVLQNIFDQPTLRSENRYFLSEDNILDWNDLRLGTELLSSVLPMATLKLNSTIQLPEQLLPGKYYLLIVNSSEGSILNSKTGIVSFNITE